MTRQIEVAYLWDDRTWNTRFIDVETDEHGNYSEHKLLNNALNLIEAENAVGCRGCFVMYEDSMEEDGE